MAAADSKTSLQVVAPKVPGLAATIAAMLRDLTRDLSGSYRPERHYMRGPGPKAQEKRAVPFGMQAA
jgi:hypothetical protein